MFAPLSPSRARIAWNPAYDRATSGRARSRRAARRPAGAQGGLMAKWVRVAYQGREYFGKLEGDAVRVHSGSMFAGPEATSQTIPLAAAKLLTPSVPSKIVALIDNFHELVAKLDHAVPTEPLYLLKGSNSLLAHGESIRAPKSYSGKVVYEGELGIVIGKRTSGVLAGDAARHIFGYTCINDVTAIEIIAKDPLFAQWTRAKSGSFAMISIAVTSLMQV